MISHCEQTFQGVVLQKRDSGLAPWIASLRPQLGRYLKVIL